MKKKNLTTILVSLILLTLILSSCASKIPDGFSEDSLIEKSKSIIYDLNDFEYDDVYEVESDELKVVLNEEQLKNAIDKKLKAAGTYEKINSYAIAGVTENGISYAKVVISCKYDKKSIVYTLVFDKDLTLCGFFFK